jgi:hypothetical protein
MFSAILAIMLLPLTDLGRSKGLQFRPIKILLWAFVFNFGILMSLGACHVEDPYIAFGQISTVFYFFYFILIGGVSLVENSLMVFNYASTFADVKYSMKSKSKAGGMKFLFLILIILNACIVVNYFTAFGLLSCFILLTVIILVERGLIILKYLINKFKLKSQLNNIESQLNEIKFNLGKIQSLLSIIKWESMLKKYDTNVIGLEGQFLYTAIVGFSTFPRFKLYTYLNKLLLKEMEDLKINKKKYVMLEFRLVWSASIHAKDNFIFLLPRNCLLEYEAKEMLLVTNPISTVILPLDWNENPIKRIIMIRRIITGLLRELSSNKCINLYSTPYLSELKTVLPINRENYEYLDFLKENLPLSNNVFITRIYLD